METTYRWFWKGWNAVNWFLILAAAFGVPIYLFYYGYHIGGSTARWPLLLVALGAAVMVMRFVYAWRREPDEFRDLEAEFKFVFSHAASAWSAGAGMACVLTGLYFFFPSEGAVYHRYAAALGIYISILGITLAVHAFYRNTAPIRDVNQLLSEVFDDLKYRCDQDSRLYIVYPALNIGYYRNLKNLGSIPPDHITMRFRELLGIKAEQLKKKAVAITYPLDLYKPLYKCYDDGVSKEEANEDRVNNCVNDAMIYIEKFTRKSIGFDGQQLQEAGRHVEIRPDLFPSQVIVIGTITYIILSYGMPIFAPTAQDPKKFHWIHGENEPANLLVYRRDDPVIAETIVRHLELIIEQVVGQKIEPPSEPVRQNINNAPDAASVATNFSPGADGKVSPTPANETTPTGSEQPPAKTQDSATPEIAKG